jgi:hypothetical protein
VNRIVDLGVYAFIVAGIYVFTKTKNGTSLVKALFGGFSNVVQSATGQKVTNFG